MPRVFLLSALFLSALFAQSNGRVVGTVTDPSGAVIPHAQVTLQNAVSGYKQTAGTGADGTFVFQNVPFHSYRLEVAAGGFALFTQDIEVATASALELKVALKLGGAATEVQVEASGAALVETVPSAHIDVDRELYSKLPMSTPASGLSDAITLSSPGVAADSNGQFHPLGDHSQTSIYIDGQPVTDQQSKQFSTQIPLNAIQTMELITSTPSAEFGDKTSLVANAVTRSGIGAARPFGDFSTNYGSFGTYGEDFDYGFGTPKFGFFLVADSARSGRFLDSPEFAPIHDIGNSESIFNRLDYQPTGKDSLHLNLFLARNWFQTPNSYDQAASSQDQRQLSRTYSIAPGYVRTLNAKTVITWNPYLRSDFIDYYPSRDPFADQPATIASKRSLKNYGTRGDFSYLNGRNNFKTGIQISRTHLTESFNFGITQPGFVDPVAQPGLAPFDLTAGGHLLQFNGATNIDQFAWYGQDSLTLGQFNLTGGLRVDYYNGLVTDSALEPRGGIAYHVKPTGTVLRIGYSHTFETPYNENLILSSTTGQGGLAANVFGAASTPLQPGRRDQYNAGLEQALLRKLVISADYFWKYTTNGFDFASLLDTPIVFPISQRKSKIDGVGARITLTNVHGFSAFVSMGHSRARYFPPSTGGLIFDSAQDTGVFRIDHDQAYQQTTHLRYQAPFKTVPWIAFTWRFDSGLVAGSAQDLPTILQLTGDQQAAIGFFCGNTFATPASGITQCTANYGATRVSIPAAGTYNADHNPARIDPRNLFDAGLGFDNLLRREHYKLKLELSATNLTNKVALYNFLSTFSGTHFVAPRAYQAVLGISF
jgi:hypothetical protein